MQDPGGAAELPLSASLRLNSLVLRTEVLRADLAPSRLSCKRVLDRSCENVASSASRRKYQPRTTGKIGRTAAVTTFSLVRGAFCTLCSIRAPVGGVRGSPLATGAGTAAADARATRTKTTSHFLRFTEPGTSTGRVGRVSTPTTPAEPSQPSSDHADTDHPCPGRARSPCPATMGPEKTETGQALTRLTGSEFHP